MSVHGSPSSVVRSMFVPLRRGRRAPLPPRCCTSDVVWVAARPAGATASSAAATRSSPASASLPRPAYAVEAVGHALRGPRRLRRRDRPDPRAQRARPLRHPDVLAGRRRRRPGDRSPPSGTSRRRADCGRPEPPTRANRTCRWSSWWTSAAPTPDAPQAEPRADEDVGRAGAGEPVDEVLREHAVDLRGPHAAPARGGRGAGSRRRRRGRSGGCGVARGRRSAGRTTPPRGRDRSPTPIRGASGCAARNVGQHLERARHRAVVAYRRHTRFGARAGPGPR